ncbi:hypothetical protein PR048_005636 [Dryococelus australis]|uniref:Uncharacterized protein n=1 Tax=Dryococelus australis TaxID=614101 RepID=A0ABQ9I8P6_9NEOP|nr:hypothetical protein PR048_005636 [Dryococelus australis]
MVQPDTDKTKAIREMPDPSNKFILQLSDIIQPLRELLKNGNEWIWGDKQKKNYGNNQAGTDAAAVQY